MSWKIKTALQLGRVSNLPTVWSNVLAGVALAGASPLNGYILPLILAMSLAYIGGMFLNDAFDRKTDATERPERPIPSGAVKAAEVFAAGFTLLIGSVFFCRHHRHRMGSQHCPGDNPMHRTGLYHSAIRCLAQRQSVQSVDYGCLSGTGNTDSRVCRY